MQDWLECGGDVIEADVIRFSDAVFERGGRTGKGKPVKMGALEITAEVVADLPDASDGLLVLRVQSLRVVDDRYGRLRHSIKSGDEIRRRKASLLKWGDPRRLPWSDESARAVVVADHASR